MSQEPGQLCGNASDSFYLTFKGGCREQVAYVDAYRCTGCGGRFHKDCILEHFKLEAGHDWGRQEERETLLARMLELIEESRDHMLPLAWMQQQIREMQK